MAILPEPAHPDSDRQRRSLEPKAIIGEGEPAAWAECRDRDGFPGFAQKLPSAQEFGRLPENRMGMTVGEGLALMHLPRVRHRFTVVGLMVAVAAVAIIFGAFSSGGCIGFIGTGPRATHRWRCVTSRRPRRPPTGRHRWTSQREGMPAEYPWPAGPPFVPAIVAHYKSLQAKYEHAARYPWLPVAPDPPLTRMKAPKPGTPATRPALREIGVGWAEWSEAHQPSRAVVGLAPLGPPYEDLKVSSNRVTPGLIGDLTVRPSSHRPCPAYPT